MGKKNTNFINNSNFYSFRNNLYCWICKTKISIKNKSFTLILFLTSSSWRFIPKFFITSLIILFPLTISLYVETSFEFNVRSFVVAQKIANETAKVFIENVKQYYKIENLYIYDEAEVENEPYNINHKKDVLIFAVIGIVIAFGYVLILNMLDTTIKSAQDIEKISGVTVLASIPIYDLAETKSKGRRGGKR